MAAPTKIATCSYCGTRAALVLNRVRHELVCSACGAPLHDLKSLPLPPKEKRPKKPDYGVSHRPPPKQHREVKSHRKRKRRGFKWFVEEAFDVIEDIFD